MKLSVLEKFAGESDAWEDNMGAGMRWIRFSWTRDWEIISDPGGPEDGKRAGW
jgi:hypothetical protein